MARYDKYDPISGGFRAPLNANLDATEDTGAGNPVGVTLNSSGRVVVGGATETLGDEPIVGLLCTTKDMKAGDIVDIMTAGEIVEVAGLTAGDTIWVLPATGALDSIAPVLGSNKTRAGTMVEATRLIVRVQSVQGGA